MKKSLVIATISLLTMGSGSVMADNLTVPNTFVSGTKAEAAKVNENFVAIETAVDEHDAQITQNENDIDTLEATKLNTTALGTALGTATTPAGNSIDNNRLLINSNTDEIAIVNAALTDKADTTTVDDLSATVAGKLYTSDLGTALGTTTTPAGNSIDNNKALIDANTTAIDGKADTATVTALSDTVDTKADTTTVTILQDTVNGNVVDIADLLGGIKDGDCIGNNGSDIMVRVGPVCVDKYEASVWADSAGTTGISAGTPYGVSSDNYPGSFPDTGNWTTKLYAVSKPGVIPSSNITWFQAQQACANVGKRLLTNAEWQMAAAGTPDPGAAGSTPATQCNTNTAGKSTTGFSTGANQCVSKWGTYDMVGNVNEWVADWIQGRYDSLVLPGANSATYGSDASNGVQPAGNQGSGATFPAAVYRGGSYNAGGTPAGVFTFSAASAPSDFQPNIGFRCAR